MSVRDDSLCNFVDLPPGFGFGETGEKDHAGDDDLRVIYRHYATLYFVFVVDQSESELGILDLIQVRHFPPGRVQPDRETDAFPPDRRSLSNPSTGVSRTSASSTSSSTLTTCVHRGEPRRV